MSGAGKRACSLREEDVIADMRAAEREVLAAYAAALGERLTRGVRSELLRLLPEAAEDCYILSGGEEEEREDAFAAFARRKKQLEDS